MSAHPRRADGGLARGVCAMHGFWLRLAKMALSQSWEWISTADYITFD